MHRLPWSNSAFTVTNLAIGITGILLRPLYPKSIFIAMFVMSASIAAFACRLALQARKNWPAASRSERGFAATVLLMTMGISTYAMYLTVLSILS
ncbi:hypothetical protein M2281_002807 [Mesorhizobium soli]|nr:hypothetical protein [Mesorhizobium soli]